MYELQTCSKPFSLFNAPINSAFFCPPPPKLSYTATLQSQPSGLLESQNVYVAEEILNIAETIGTQNFFSEYQAGFTLAIREPPYSVCSCQNSTLDCDNIAALMTSNPTAEEGPHYTVNQACALAYTLCAYGGDCSSLDALGSFCSDLGASFSFGTTSLTCNDSTQPGFTVDGLSSDLLQVRKNRLHLL